jgi:hypothetical protein
MIILQPECLGHILNWDTIGQDIMNSLNMKRLLYLGVRRNIQVEEDEGGNGDEEQQID